MQRGIQFFYNNQIRMDHSQSDFFSEPAEWPQTIVQKLSSERPQPEHAPPVPIQSSVIHEYHEQSSLIDRHNILDYELNPYDQYIANIQKYPYSRAYHYFFDLDIFERDPQSVTYAIDPNNAFKSTFSKEQKLIGGSKIKDIINRKYFILPLNQQDDGHSSRAKNPSHRQLFQTEDKKIWFDRLIVTCRQILNNLERLVHSGKIYSFLSLYKDKKLKQILDPSKSVSEKRQILIKRLQRLLELKMISQKGWIAEDNINLYPSFNQRHYQLIRVKLLMFQRSRIVGSLVSNYMYLKELVKESTNQQRAHFIQKVFTYKREEHLSLKKQTITSLALDFNTKFMQKINGSSAIIFPSHLLSFSNPQIIKITNYILGKRIKMKSNQQFCLLKLICQRLFKTPLLPQDDDIQEDIEDDYFFNLDTSKALSEIRRLKLEKTQMQQQYLKQSFLLDKEINYEALLSSQEKVFVLKRKQVIELSGAEYVLLMHWHWMAVIVKEMYSYIKINPKFINILTSAHYENVRVSVSQAFDNPVIGTFSYCIDEISKELTENSQLNFHTFRLQYEFWQEKSLVILWRLEQDIQELRQVENEQADYDILHFGKRVKSLQNEWA